MSRKIGIVFVYLVHIIGWAFGLISVIAAVIAWIVATPFAAAGFALIGEPVSLNLSGLKELIVAIWEDFS